jgi:hypothetical protein
VDEAVRLDLLGGCHDRRARHRSQAIFRLRDGNRPRQMKGGVVAESYRSRRG